MSRNDTVQDGINNLRNSLGCLKQFLINVTCVAALVSPISMIVLGFTGYIRDSTSHWIIPTCFILVGICVCLILSFSLVEGFWWKRISDMHWVRVVIFFLRFFLIVGLFIGTIFAFASSKIVFNYVCHNIIDALANCTLEMHFHNHLVYEVSYGVGTFLLTLLIIGIIPCVIFRPTTPGNPENVGLTENSQGENTPLLSNATGSATFGKLLETCLSHIDFTATLTGPVTITVIAMYAVVQHTLPNNGIAGCFLTVGICICIILTCFLAERFHLINSQHSAKKWLSFLLTISNIGFLNCLVIGAILTFTVEKNLFYYQCNHKYSRNVTIGCNRDNHYHNEIAFKVTYVVAIVLLLATFAAHVFSVIYDRFNGQQPTQATFLIDQCNPGQQADGIDQNADGNNN